VTALRPHLATLVDEWERHGRDLAVVSQRGLRTRSISYGDLAALARRFARELVIRGIPKGDRVVLWGANGPEWIGAFFGCVLRGVIPVPLDFGSPVEFVERIIHEVDARLLAGTREPTRALVTPPPLLLFEDFDTGLPAEGAAALEDLKEEDTLQIVFTSGTTGEPKGVVHTHKNVLASLRPIEAEIRGYLKWERFVHPIRILHTLPLSHVFGQFMGLWIPALLAAEVHFEDRLVAAEMIGSIRQKHISVLASVPRVLDLLQSRLMEIHPDLSERLERSRDLRAWKRWWRFRDIHRLFGFKFWAFVSGGAALRQDSEQFWNALGFPVIQGYGMTETTALVSLNHPFKLARGTIGQILPGREVRLSEEGEVLVRGDTISNTTWQGGRLRQEGSEWLATGDLAEFDEAGNLRFRGRRKDVIVTAAGLNIHPEDLEAALNRQPGVKTSAVVESQSAAGPEPLAALVVDPTRDVQGIVAGANAGLASFQQIRRWIVWPEPDLPRTSTGKILRREVARRIAESEVLPGNTLTAGSEELQLDSLARVQLQAQLEQQYGIALEEEAVQNVKSTEDVRRLIASRTPVSIGPQKETRESHVYPHWPWWRAMQGIRAVFLELVAMPLVRLLAKPHVKRGSLPTKGPILIVANHVTSYDAALVLYALPRRLRLRVAVAMSGEMILDWRKGRNQGHALLDLLAPLEYWVVTALFNVFPLPQLSGFRRSFQHAGEAVDRGYSVLIFPEGRRADDENLQPFKRGTGLLWKELGIPVVTVRLHGLGEIKRRRLSWFRSKLIRLSVGEPIALDTSRSPEELTEMLRSAVENQ
jgi:long-chain acyl-CoA synthetase